MVDQTGPNNPYWKGALWKKHPYTYQSWQCMRNRCNNPGNKDYRKYGAKGITVCARWDEFANFLADMGERPRGTTIDRFPNPDGNYEPSNCRWATPHEQVAHLRRPKRGKYKPAFKRKLCCGSLRRHRATCPRSSYPKRDEARLASGAQPLSP